MNIDMIQLGVTFVLGLILLIKSSDFFVEASEKVSLKFGIPQFIVGVTIVGIGTSLPELITSILATLEGESQVVAGNAIGSNITNILLVLGFSLVLAKKMQVRKNMNLIDIPMLILITGALIIMMMDSKFMLFESLILLSFYITYVYYIIESHKKPHLFESENEYSSEVINQAKKNKIGKLIAIILLSGVGIYFGAKYTISSVIGLSEMFSLDSSVIALTLIALGTSLPELSVAYSSIKRKNYDIVIGNVIGSNIFNSTLVIGIPGLLGTLNISQETMYIGLPFLMFSTFMLILAFINNQIFKHEGIMYLTAYVFFIYQFSNYML